MKDFNISKEEATAMREQIRAESTRQNRMNNFR